jgi:hypothetical protein
MIHDDAHEYAAVFEENIPEKLKRIEQWVNWRGEWSESKEKLNKVPKQHNGNAASSTDENTWTTFGVALAAALERTRFGIGLAGLERTPLTGIDLDKCIDPGTGEIHPAALKIVEDFDSYTEVTPTGTGLRIWVEAEKVPTWSANKGGEIDIEVYSRGRFFTVTGRHLEGTPRTIDRRQAELDAFMRDYAPPKREQRVREPYRGPTGDYVLDLESFLEEFGVTVKGPLRDNTSQSAYRIVCPWVHEHTGEDDSGTRVGQYESGALWFKCDHAHCDGRRWEEFREELDPEAYRRVTFTVGGKKRSKFTDSTNPPQPGRFERIDLGEPIESGVDPAEMLVADVLYAGSVHGIYARGGMGKTLLGLWLIKEVIKQGLSVILLDQENGIRIVSERLRALGLSAEEARRNLYYYPFPSMPLEDEAIAEFEELLDEVKPALVVCDSWINFLAAAGLDENSSVDIAHWADAYSQKARQRGMAILLLDHIPKEGNTARGSGRKLDYVDVMWELTKPQDFDRETVGRIDLRLKKDREGWMPWGVAFSVGGKDGSLIFGRTTFDKSTFVGDALRPKEKATLEALKSFGDAGARYTPWLKEAEKRGLSSATFKRALDTLLRTDLVEKIMDKYFYKTPAKQKDHFGSKKAHEPNEPTASGGKAHRAHTPRGEPSEPNQADPSGEGVKNAVFDDEEEL